MNRTTLARAARLLAALALVDAAAIVISGGVSLAGPADPGGIAARFLVASVLVAVAGPGTRWDRGYLLVLLALAALLHARGYRLRGDGLWYYSFSHSLAFDRDVDLANQYRRLGIDALPGSQPVRETGIARFTYPVGAPILWVPFIGLGHAGAWLRNAHGLETAYDGFSDPYFHAVALGNLVLGWLGLLVLDRLLRRWFAPWASFLSATGLVLASFLAWYLTYHSIYTHALTFLLAAIFVKLWVDGPSELRSFALLGLVLGATAAVRWQSAVFAMLPAISIAGRLFRREWRFALGSGLALALAALAAFSPQLLVWKAIYDRFYVGVPLGDDYVRWGDPFLTEILFSSRHGLFSWSPILIAATIGLVGFVRKSPRHGAPLAAVVVVVWYVNSAVADWWGGGSFGARRFDSVLPILGLGLATALVWATELVRRHPRWITAGAVASAVGANALLMEQYRKGRLPVDDTMSWQAAAEAGLEDWFDAVGYPFSFPMNWRFAIRYHRPKTQYDILVGKYLFHRMHGLQGLIDLGEKDPPFLGNGWSGVADWKDRKREVRLALGKQGAGLFVPVDQPEPLKLFLECAAPEGADPRPVEVRLNGIRLGSFLPSRDMAEQIFTAERALWRRVNLLEILPAEGGAPGPFLAVDRLRFERLSF